MELYDTVADGKVTDEELEEAGDAEVVPGAAVLLALLAFDVTAADDDALITDEEGVGVACTL